MFGKFFKYLIEGHPDWQEEQRQKQLLRELDEEYPSSCFNYDPDEEGYDRGAHRRNEYDRKRREIKGEDTESPYGDFEYDP